MQVKEAIESSFNVVMHVFNRHKIDLENFAIDKSQFNVGRMFNIKCREQHDWDVSVAKDTLTLTTAINNIIYEVDL